RHAAREVDGGSDRTLWHLGVTTPQPAARRRTPYSPVASPKQNGRRRSPTRRRAKPLRQCDLRPLVPAGTASLELDCHSTPRWRCTKSIFLATHPPLPPRQRTGPAPPL